MKQFSVNSVDFAAHPVSLFKKKLDPGVYLVTVALFGMPAKTPVTHVNTPNGTVAQVREPKRSMDWIVSFNGGSAPTGKLPVKQMFYVTAEDPPFELVAMGGQSTPGYGIIGSWDLEKIA